MKYQKLFFEFICGCAFLFSIQGCYPYYAFGNGGVEPIVFVKPVYADSSRVTTYIGGKYTHSVDSAFGHRNESNYFGQIYWSQTQTERNYNFSYGVFGYLGSYRVVEVPLFQGNKPYYGGGLSGEISINTPFRNFDLRFAGLKGTLYYENGEFSRFRRMASEQVLITGVNSSLFAYNLSYTIGGDFNLKRQNSLGFAASYGITYPINEEDAFFTSSLNLHYTNNQVTTFIQYTDCLFAMGGEFALGFNFRIK